MNMNAKDIQEKYKVLRSNTPIGRKTSIGASSRSVSRHMRTSAPETPFDEVIHQTSGSNQV